MSKIEINQRALDEIYEALDRLSDRMVTHARESAEKNHNPEVASFWEGYIAGVGDAGLEVEGQVKTSGKFTIIGAENE